MNCPDEDRCHDTLLIRVARALFDESTLSAIVYPAIADVRHELRDAGSSRRRRLLARWRGLRALGAVAVSLLLTSPLPVSDRLTSVHSRRDEVVFTLLLAVFYATFGPLALGSFLMAVPLAVGMHWWYSRHLGRTRPPDVPDLLRTPEINFASVWVSANAGGLFFVVGTIGIVLLGIPGLATFFVGVVIAALLLAGALVLWRAGHHSMIKSSRFRVLGF